MKKYLYQIQVVIKLSIPKYLENKIKSIPEKPGIYKMKDSQGNILYIGKSKCLNKRVKSYFQSNHEWSKINRLVFNIRDIDFIVTDTHLEAQLLECALIKKHKPIYNSQFVNDKNYVYLKVEDYNTSNALSVTTKKDSELCFGPYRSRYILFDVVDLLKKLYPIKKYKDSYEFIYSPLPFTMGKDEFEINKKCLIEILTQENSMESFLSVVKIKMKEAASSLQFERASNYRDILSMLEYLYKANKVNITKDNRILMGEKIDDGYKLFFISDGYLIYKKKFQDISVKSIKDFIAKSKGLESNVISYGNEKRSMDFKSIINRELKDNYLKSIQIIDDNFNPKLFLDELLNL